MRTSPQNILVESKSNVCFLGKAHKIKKLGHNPRQLLFLLMLPQNIVPPAHGEDNAKRWFHLLLPQRGCIDMFYCPPTAHSSNMVGTFAACSSVRLSAFSMAAFLSCRNLSSLSILTPPPARSGLLRALPPPAVWTWE